ncbi:fumarylacetoacetate hydrolase family protein [Sinorhizobium americanum]|uniref:5-oxopent-3-ene-1,2,5-tricarboxylate decarboxylase n=1 Tax=Sinorhizobium americanum TaxID=194963 RepID=A0A1L3LZ12_9HYPH|nr:fumarylacetoacetate hydrolase family protein [Sinorhizobium americanum]APG95253.1 5-oxopent-3-ene-1,2,5-tricarboxylate decarboxylase [Sinorhizobium americanum]OAP50137.1 5-oxopent-3-ene-1,2,5-tricarboxylate decarboxylase [Sinorhizobium americanum]
MRLVTFRRQGSAQPGIVLGDDIHEISSHADVKAVLADLEGIKYKDVAATSIADADLLPPIANPAKIICVGLNYLDHRIETRRPETAFPTLFIRWPDTQVGHSQALVCPKEPSRFDYEGELAIVIGKGGRHIPADQAMSHVIGYSCYNDGSVRDWQKHTSQFTPGKNFIASAGFGPWLVIDEIADPNTLTLTTRLNGEVVQQSGLDLLIFSIPELIAYISTFTELSIGDVIVTGTPGGVGDRRDPPLYMKPGDIVEVEVTGVGTLVNSVVAAQ